MVKMRCERDEQVVDELGFEVDIELHRALMQLAATRLHNHPTIH